MFSIFWTENQNIYIIYCIYYMHNTQNKCSQFLSPVWVNRWVFCHLTTMAGKSDDASFAYSSWQTVPGTVLNSGWLDVYMPQNLSPCALISIHWCHGCQLQTVPYYGTLWIDVKICLNFTFYQFSNFRYASSYVS